MKIKNYLKEDWKYLLILDACRYDLFKEVIDEYNLEGNLQLIDSGASDTEKWYLEHWSEKNDVVLVTSNPRPLICKDSFYKVVKAWEGNEINPVTTLKYLENEKVPNKRHLIHFIPPHLSYIGPKGRAFLKKIKAIDNRRMPIFRNIYNAIQDYGRKNGWDELKVYYKESIKTILDIILRREYLFDGKVIITSDHGELIGENGNYNHDWDRDKTGVLRKVPWFEWRALNEKL